MLHFPPLTHPLGSDYVLEGGRGAYPLLCDAHERGGGAAGCFTSLRLPTHSALLVTQVNAVYQERCITVEGSAIKPLLK